MNACLSRISRCAPAGANGIVHFAHISAAANFDAGRNAQISRISSSVPAQARAVDRRRARAQSAAASAACGLRASAACGSRASAADGALRLRVRPSAEAPT